MVSGEGGSMGRGARPSLGRLPGGLGLSAIAREVRQRGAWCWAVWQLCLGGERLLQTVTSCYLGIYTNIFVGLNSVLSVIQGRLLLKYQLEV